MRKKVVLGMKDEFYLEEIVGEYTDREKELSRKFRFLVAFPRWFGEVEIEKDGLIVSRFKKGEVDFVVVEKYVEDLDTIKGYAIFRDKEEFIGFEFEVSYPMHVETDVEKMNKVYRRLIDFLADLYWEG